MQGMRDAQQQRAAAQQAADEAAAAAASSGDGAKAPVAIGEAAALMELEELEYLKLEQQMRAQLGLTGIEESVSTGG